MISIVIPGYNEEKLVTKCLDSLVKQVTSQPFEVIFIDNASTDTTRHIAQSYKYRLNLHIFIERKKGRGSARRLGFSKAIGDIILSTDADTVVPVNWIEQLTRSFTDTSIAAVTGTCRIVDCSFITNILFNNFYQISTELFYRFTEGHWCLIGPNFAVRRAMYLKISGFDASLNCREDADISGKIAAVGKIKRSNLSVVFSGRRYKHGLLFGAIPYLFSRLKGIYIGKQKIILTDIR